MLQRLYTHNFRCFENFEFKPLGQSSALLLGKNGSGKTNLRKVLALFQTIGRGTPRVGDLVKLTDFSLGRSELPMRFEIEVLLTERRFVYTLALELPDRFRELRVAEERLTLDGEALFTRERAEVTLHRGAQGKEASMFSIDWHLIALPVIQDPTAASALQDLRKWMASMVLLAPIPQQMNADAQGGVSALSESAENLADWLASLLESAPAAYSTIMGQLQQVMPDLASFRFERLGKDVKALQVQFEQGAQRYELAFSALSDGEKCFFLCALVLATNQHDGPIFAFWDEPDNYLAPHEVNQFVMALKRSFLRTRGQVLMSSHNPQAILCFSDDSTWVMGRRGHLEPSQIRCLDELTASLQRTEESQRPDLLQRLLDGDIDPWQ